MRPAIALVVALLSFPTLAQERVLIPVAYEGRGAHGSYWYTSIGGWNRTSVPWRSPGVGFIVWCPIPEGCFTEELAPGHTGWIVTVSSSDPSLDRFDAPKGFFIQLPPGQSTKPAIWGRFSSPPNSPSTELPTPSESEFTTGMLFLPQTTIENLPVRTLLRIYALDSTRKVTVRVNARPPFIAAVETKTVVVESADGPNVPGYGELSLTGAFGRRFTSAHIEVVQEPDPDGAPPVRLWAFITMTNTRTNAVGVVTPR